MPDAPARKPCLGLLLCALPAIMLSEFLPCSLLFALPAALCFCIAAIRGRRLLPTCLLVFTVFLARHEMDWRRNPGRLPLDLLSQGHALVHTTGIVTTDPAIAGYADHIPHYRFNLQVAGIQFKGRSLTTDLPVEVYWTGAPPAWGDEVEFDAAITQVESPRNPGEFNYATWLARKGIFAQLTCDYPEDAHILAHGKGNPLIAAARECRVFLQRRLTLGIDDDPEISGLIQTITLGLKQEISADDRELFQHVGAMHLFVVNGLHIALLAAILQILFRPFRIQQRAFALFIIPILFGYALLTGLNPGSVRAALMAAVFFGATFFERRPFSINTLAAAALTLLLCDTNELFNQGAQFSFGVVTSIILFTDFVQARISPIGAPDPYLPRPLWSGWQLKRNFLWRNFAGLAAVSVAASIGSFPFTAGYFNLVTPSGFLANLLLVPIAFCILAEAIFSLLATWAGSVAILFNNCNWLIASLMLWLVRMFAMLPGGHFFISTSPNLSDCRITVLDLSTAQAVVIESRHSVWLVDCGNTSSYLRIVRPFLQSRGVNHLDGLILTHGSAVNIGAARNVVADFSPGALIEADTTDRSAARRDIQNMGRPITIVHAGSQFPLSSAVNCAVLFPPSGFQTAAASDKSLVLRIEDGPSRILLMSESAFTGEHWLLDHPADLRASIIVFGGHGEDLGGTDEFIAAAHPYAAVRGTPAFAVSPGGERHWAANIRKHGTAPVLQSDAGAVTIDLDKSGSTVTGFLNHQRFASRSE